jgi:tetratricopeptide (TPR) repeat protein
MKRTALVALAVAVVAVAAALLYTTAARESEYRRLIADGERALGADQTFVAVESFSGAIALKGDSMLAYLRRGEAYRRRGGQDDLQKALRDLRMAAQLDPGAPKPREELGDVNFALERYARAAESYDGYLTLDDQSAAVRYKLALSRFRLGDAAGAILPLRQAVALDDRFAEAHYLLGVCYAQAGQAPDAVSALERAVQLAPTLLPARQELVRLLLVQKRESDAIRELEKLAAFEPGRTDYLVEAALVYGRLGRTDLAVIEINRALERDPAQPLVYQALGQVWLQSAESRNDPNALHKALEALDQAVRAPNATSGALTLYGRALALSGDAAGAQRAFQQAVEKTPADPRAYRELATVAQRRGDVLLARDALVRYLALATEPTAVREVSERIGELSLRLGQPDQAAKWLRQAAEQGDDDVATTSRLAVLQLRAGDRAGAAATVDKGLKKAPTSPALLALRRQAQ